MTFRPRISLSAVSFGIPFFDWKDCTLDFNRRYKRNQMPIPHSVFIFAATRKLFAICA